MNVYIETYGCQMNKLDSEYVQAILEGEGFDIVPDKSCADVILLNTCGVRENAEIRIHGRIGELSALKRQRPQILFGIIGCMAQRLGNSLISDVVRLIAGPDSYRNLPEMVRRAVGTDYNLSLQNAAAEPAVDTNLGGAETYENIEPVRKDGFSAWVAVMRGCNNFCSYCIVPYTRGRERSIPVNRILSEIERLRQNGRREVTLLGQNVNSYCDGDVDFAGLLDRAADTGIGWIRFLTSNPKDLTVDILKVMAGRENVCSHLHLPLQSGSDSILAAMNRGYTTGEYMSLIEQARDIVEGISITTDMMFGFPGETDRDFKDSLSVMETVRYDYAFLYRYSERAGTKASSMDGSVPEHIRKERLKEAIELQKAITQERHTEQVGTTHKVLIKGLSKDGKGWFGFSEKSIPVVVTGSGDGVLAGSFVKAHITGTTGASLLGNHEL